MTAIASWQGPPDGGNTPTGVRQSQRERVEMRSTDGWYVARFGFVDEQFHHRFDTVVGAVKEATGEATA